MITPPQIAPASTANTIPLFIRLARSLRLVKFYRWQIDPTCDKKSATHSTAECQYPFKAGRNTINRYLRSLPPLETLITFEAVGRHASFTGASSELFLTQSAVSKQMRQLEACVGVPLFERKPRGVALTTAGEELLVTVNVMLTTMYQSVTRIRNVHQSNAVSVLATHALAQFWLFPKLIEFNKAYPDIAVHVHAINEIDEASLNDFDLGVLYGAGEWASLNSDFLLPEIVYPAAHPSFDVAGIETLAQLAQANLIQIDTSAWRCLDWHQWFTHLGHDYSAPDKAPVFNQLTLAFRAVQQGMGIGLAWSFMGDEAIAKGELQRVTSFECVTGFGEFLVSVKHRKLSPCAEIFRQWLLASAALDSPAPQAGADPCPSVKPVSNQPASARHE